MKKLYQFIAISLLNVLIIFCVLEVGVRFGVGLLRHRQGEQSKSKHLHALEKLYSTFAWGPAYQSDEAKNAFTVNYYPYEEFRMRPFASKTINIDNDGFRKTPGQPTTFKKSIWMFGGSTMLGGGVPDEYTIPAELQKLFNSETPTISVRVVNCGITAWISSQEAIGLVKKLKTEQSPDLVIFYDGINDTAWAVRNFLSDAPWMAWQLKDFFEGGNEFLKFAASRQNVPGSHLLHAVFVIFRSRLGLTIPYIPILEKAHYSRDILGQDLFAKASDQKKDELAAQVVDNYLANIRFVRALGKAYNFKTMFFWQPTVYSSPSSKPYSSYEVDIVGERDKNIEDLWQRIHKFFGNNAGFVNLQGAFTDMKETVYLDHCHLLPDGNRRIAEIIYKRIREIPGF